MIMGLSNPQAGYNMNQSPNFLRTCLEGLYSFQISRLWESRSRGKKQEPLISGQESMVQLVFGRNMEENVNKQRLGS